MHIIIFSIYVGSCVKQYLHYLLVPENTCIVQRLLTVMILYINLSAVGQ